VVLPAFVSPLFINMKKMLLALCLWGLLAGSAAAQKQGSFAKDFLPLWKRSAAYTLKVAEAMPAEYYIYKPHDEALSFAQQLVHIAENLYWLNATYVLEEENPLGNNRLQNPDKQAVVKQLQNALNYVESSLKDISDSQVAQPLKFGGAQVDKERIFYLMRDHMTHHRAQAVLYLRLNGMEPPRYTGW